MEATKEASAPTTGAEIVLKEGIAVTVHADCKKVRDAFTRFLRRRSRELIDEQLRDKDISKQEHAAQREATFAPLFAAYGSTAYAGAASTDEGAKQLLFIRISLNYPKADLADVVAWVDANGWGEATRVMMEADGFAPKSNTQEDGEAS